MRLPGRREATIRGWGEGGSTWLNPSPSGPGGLTASETHRVLGISSSMAAARSPQPRPSRTSHGADPWVESAREGDPEPQGSAADNKAPCPRLSSQDGAGGQRGPSRPKEGVDCACAAVLTPVCVGAQTNPLPASMRFLFLLVPGN